MVNTRTNEKKSYAKIHEYQPPLKNTDFFRANLLNSKIKTL